MKRQRTKFPGVYQRKAVNRKNGKKPDVCFDFSYKADGKKVWEKAGWLSEGYSAKLAADIRAERLRSCRHGEALPKQKKKAPYMKDVWEKYKTWAMTNKARAGRDDIYEYKNHLKLRYENKRLNEISSFDLERLKAGLTKKGLSPASVKHCLILIRQIYNKAITWGLYQGQNPIKGVKMPSLQNERTRFLSHEEAGRLLEYLKISKPRTKKDGTPAKVKESPSFLHDISLLSLHTGMRAGEIFALRGQDIDMVNAIITIRDPKNKTTRHAYMTAAVQEMLAQRIPSSPDILVFPDIRGNEAVAVSQNFRKAVVTLGLNNGINDPREKVTFHTLRHTFASWLALQGETILTIKELLGHKSLAMTTRYAHLMPDEKKRATLNLEKNFIQKRSGSSSNVGGDNGK
jgi:integrase